MAHPHPDGFLATPPSAKGPGVLVLHAWWGLNDSVKDFCRQLGSAGFTAFAPDLYHGAVAETISDAETLGQALDDNYIQAKAEIAKAVLYLRKHAKVREQGLAVIAFSLGAYYALDLAASDPDHIHAVVLFYGTGDGDYRTSRAAYLGHFAEEDPFEPKSNVDALEENLKRVGRPVTFYHYPGTGHWFFEPDRTDAYNEPAAELAWKRTLAFLKEVFHW